VKNSRQGGKQEHQGYKHKKKKKNGLFPEKKEKNYDYLIRGVKIRMRERGGKKKEGPL